MKITKLEAARRQLITAIQLFFKDADSISVYTLAHASWEVLDALCADRNLLRFRETISDANNLSEKEVKRIASYGRNFFKHANRDPESTLDEFNDELNDPVLLAGTYDYGVLSNSKPMEVQVFQLWYFAVNPEKALQPQMDEIIAAGKKLFPNIVKANRRQKKREGLRVLKIALRDQTLMTAPSTDRTPVRAID